MADALVDFASLDSAAADTTVDTTVDTSVADTTTDSTVDAATTDSAETVVDSTDGKETETHKADGTERTPEEVEEFKKTAAAKVASDKTLESTPANVRTALKAMRDADPKNAGVVKELHGAYERWNAAKQIFPKGVAEMTEAKAFIDSVGGPEGYQKSQDMIEAVLATDELLYAADPKLWDNVIEDLKSSGHPEALGQLAPSFLAKLKATDSDAFYNTTIPVVAEAMKEIHMDSFVKQFNEAINEKDSTGKVTPNVAKVTELIKGLTDWYTDLDKDAKARTAAPADTPERKKFLAEKAEFERTKTTAAAEERKKTELGIAEECDKHNNRSLGKVLGGFLKMPFFKDFPYETKVDLGNGIKDRLYAALKADKAYQTQMAAMWKTKTPDRAKMLQYHQAKVDSIATDIVTKTVQNRYPGYAKGGSAAGKAAAAVVKKADATKAAASSVVSGKPIYVASRPENLVREAIKVGGKDYSQSDLVTLQIMGRGFVKTTDGKGFKFITWRK
jgi:hypothetical protein